MSPRVGGGSVKGAALKAPRDAHTRPTSDKVRQAIFDVIGSAVVDSRVLDLYAGTGALGIEALSRGAETADFVEARSAAWRAIEANVCSLGMQSRATIWRMPVMKALSRLDRAFDLILADPPYADRDIEGMMESLASGDVVEPGGLVVLEHGKRIETQSEYGSLRRWQLKRYGDSMVSFYRRAFQPSAEPTDSGKERG
ncbi:MAG TPA: 16S rRNA (guanine(966)-N(2))-methyltransferase RsmD [Chloroflexota bacterium]|nr:16S rRNA (guanine(966)-N(2))-methyltransferase RsmD [Chloroflexota bacterium]